MKKQIKLTVFLTLGLFVLVILLSSVWADQSSEEKPSKAETIEKVTTSDKMAEIFKHYFAMRELLAQDKVDQVSAHAQKMSIQLGNLIETLESIRASSANLKTDNLENARKGFASLSQSMLSYLKQFGFSGKAYSFHCSMQKESWLQENDQIGNPYYGSKMFKCGKMTGMTVNGKYMEKAEGESEPSMQMKGMGGK